jgi:hypothetical protein
MERRCPIDKDGRRVGYVPTLPFRVFAHGLAGFTERLPPQSLVPDTATGLLSVQPVVEVQGRAHA